MNKKTSIFAASYLGVAAVWLGGHFGPGFATGAFSVTYFVKYGWIGVLMPLVAMLITGGVVYFMTEYARSHGITNYRPFAISCFGESMGNIMSILYDILFLGMVLCAGGLAFSGEATVLSNFLGFSYWGAAIPTIIVSALLCLYGSRILSLCSKYMMYAIVLVVLLIMILSFAFGDYDLGAAIASTPVAGSDATLVDAFLSALLYGCFQSTVAFNVVSVSDVLESKEDAKKAVLAGYVVTVILMIAFALTLFSYVTVIEDLCSNTTPIMAVLNRLGISWLSWSFVILMTLAVLTTAAGLANAGCARFDRLFASIESKQVRRTVITIILLGIAAIGASFGMKALLQKGTSYIGYIGIFGLVIPAFTIIAAKVRKGE